MSDKGNEALQAELKEELKELNREQEREFLWRFWVILLPFFVTGKRFKRWNTEEKVIYLYDIFLLLDGLCLLSSGEIQEGDLKAFARALDLARDLDLDRILTRALTLDRARSRSRSRALTLDLALALALDLDLDLDLEFDIVRDLDCDRDRDRDRALALARALNIDFNLDLGYMINTVTLSLSSRFFSDKSALFHFILNEITSIKTNAPSPFSRKNYDSLWKNFESTLQELGCEYWGTLYRNIIDNHFHKDKEKLKQRIHVLVEIQKSGASAVAHYLEELEEGAVQLNEARIIILGDKGSGKTSLARRLINPQAKMPELEESTKGVDIDIWEAEHKNEKMNVWIWDFAGHAVTHSVHKFFLSERCIYIVLCNGRREETEKVIYWLNMKKNYGANSPAIVLVNKFDEHSVELSQPDLDEKFENLEYHNFSIKNDSQSVEDFRSLLKQKIQQNPSWQKNTIPVSYYRVKKELEKKFHTSKNQKKEEMISKKDFDAIIEKQNISSGDELLENLHNLGIGLWYNDENIGNFSDVILNPNWITDGVYTIINWMSEKKTPVLNLSDLKTIFQEEEERFPEDKHSYLYNLMIHYELAYRGEDEEQGQFIIPHLMEKHRPKKLPNFPVLESLACQYSSDFPLPPDTVSRFIVRNHKLIKKPDANQKHVWRLGVVLEDGKGNTALIRENTEKNRISIEVKGSAKTKFFGMIRSDMDAIFQSYTSENPEILYRIITNRDKIEIFLSGKKILAHEKHGRLYFYAERGEDIPLDSTIIDYGIRDSSIVDNSTNITVKIEDNSTNIIFNQCTLNLINNFSELKQGLVENNCQDEAEQVEDLEIMLKGIKDIENLNDSRVKRVWAKVKKFTNDAQNPNTKTGKTVGTVKNGLALVNTIAGILKLLGVIG